MNDEQNMVGMLAVFLVLMTVWLVYKQQMKAILFQPPLSAPPASIPNQIQNYLFNPFNFNPFHVPIP